MGDEKKLLEDLKKSLHFGSIVYIKVNTSKA
jgi:hypothetical protein